MLFYLFIYFWKKVNKGPTYDVLLIAQMEALLSSAFELLSSYDPLDIRKGLRQLDSLFAHLCLHDRSAFDKKDNGRNKKPEPDEAMVEFIKLQNGFEFNVCSELIHSLERLLGKPYNELIQGLMATNLMLLQGIVLIHPSSKRLFSKTVNMTVLLDMLESQYSALHVALCRTLVCCMIDEWRNVRVFEELEGLEAIAILFRDGNTSQEVKVKLLEFLYFYLIPETTTSNSVAGTHVKKDVKNEEIRDRGRLAPMTRCVSEKENMLAQCFGRGIRDQVTKDIKHLKPFGGLV